MSEATLLLRMQDTDLQLMRLRKALAAMRVPSCQILVSASTCTCGKASFT